MQRHDRMTQEPTWYPGPCASALHRARVPARHPRLVEYDRPCHRGVQRADAPAHGDAHQ